MKVTAFLLAMTLPFATFYSYALGDLFISHSQRQLIDTMREQNGTEQLVLPVAAGVLKVNGFYYKAQQRNNKKVLWLNGHQVPATGDFKGGSTQHLNKRDKTVAIKLEGMQKTLSVKAGQKVQLDQLNIMDAYQ